MKCFKKIIPFFFVFTILVSSILPSHAAGVGWGRVGIGEWAEERGQNGFLEIYEDYDQYVSDLQSDLGTTTLIDGGVRLYLPALSINSKSESMNVYSTSLGNVWSCQYSVPMYNNSFRFSVNFPESFELPFNCTWKKGYWISDNLSFCYGDSNYITSGNGYSGDLVTLGYSWPVFDQSGPYGEICVGYGSHWVDFFPITSLSDATSLNVTINSRPTSIVGDYGIIGDNGSIIKVDGNMIVDESSSTVYNPVTNTTLNYTDYAYDYSDRSYNLTLEDGSTMKVTYGDENVTINEGDTVYNIYYIVPEADQEDDGSGSGGSGDTHSHDYTSEITKLPNCLLSGVRTFTCSCGDSYTKTVPATGHDWQISQQIANTFDPETGEPLTTGYTIYTCATCGEQYKSTDGNAPPNGSTGDDEDGGGLISGLLGAVGDVIGGLIEGLLLLATKALEALTGLGDLFAQMIETVLDFFGGFIDFLSAMFPFLPEETITILNLGLILMIAAAVFNRFFK